MLNELYGTLDTRRAPSDTLPAPRRVVYGRLVIAHRMCMSTAAVTLGGGGGSREACLAVQRVPELGPQAVLLLLQLTEPLRVAVAEDDHVQQRLRRRVGAGKHQEEGLRRDVPR